MSLIPEISENEKYYRVMNALADAVLKNEPESLTDESPQSGGEAKQLRRLMIGTVKDFRQKHLRAALLEYQSQVKEIRAHQYAIPTTPEARRKLLESVFSKNPGMQNAFLTVQHREFTAFSDSDIKSLLKQLFELKVLS